MGTNFYHHKYLEDPKVDLAASRIRAGAEFGTGITLPVDFERHVRNVLRETLGQEKVVTHIGKSSFGWSFSFHATDTLRSWKQWKEELQIPGSYILDEYGKRVTFEEMVSNVEDRQRHWDEAERRNGRVVPRPLSNHSGNHTTPNDYGDFLDDEGYSFSEGEFS